jgi:hypothetical protein
MSGLDRFRAIAARLGVDVRENDVVPLDVPTTETARVKLHAVRHADLPEHQRWAAELDRLPDDDDPCPGWRRGMWARTLDAAIGFIFEHGERGAELGWDAASLFGVDPRVGIARIGACGALVLGSGWRVARVERDAITFENNLVYRKGTWRGPKLVPVWAFGRSASPASNEAASESGIPA